MKAIFLSYLQVSLSGSIIVCLVLLLRMVLKRAPRRIVCFLWLLVGLRLLIPIHFESDLSLQPPILTSFESIAEQAPVPPAATQDPLLPPNQSQAATIPQSTVSHRFFSPTDPIAVASYIWAAGLCAMLLYAIISYLRFRRKVAGAVRLSDGIWECRSIDTAFVLGFISPRIYLPAGLSDTHKSFILSHEYTHMERGDNWWRLLGFFCLSIHWFNPLVWLGFAILNRDIEMACDEKVVKFMTLEERKAYATALLSCSAGRHRFSVCPVAFGESSVKQRIVTVLNYRKPGFWICLVAIVLLLAVAVFFLTSPVTDIAVQKLRQCEAALDSWQRMDSYHIHTENHFEGDVLLNSSHSDYWASGENFLQVVHLPGANGDTTMRHLKQDGRQFSYTAWTSGEDAQPGNSGWVETEFSPYDVSAPWPMIFSWEDATVLYSGTEVSGSQELVTVRLVSSPYPEAIDPLSQVDYYHTDLTFCFDLNGTLLCVTRVTVNDSSFVDNGQQVFSATKSTSTFWMMSTDAQEIAQCIHAELIHATSGS